MSISWESYIFSVLISDDWGVQKWMQIQKIQLQFNREIQQSYQETLQKCFKILSAYCYILFNKLNKYFYLLAITVIIMVFADFEGQ